MIRPLSTELQDKATKELNEDLSRREDDLSTIHDWLNKQPHLNARTDDQWIISFLRGCKFSIEKTKQKLDCFYTMRTLVPEFFANRDPFSAEVQEVLKSGVLMPLPKTIGVTGARILILRLSEANPDTVSLTNITKVYFMLFDIMLREDDNLVVSRVYVILDFRGLPLGYLKQYTPSYIKKSIICIYKAYPARIKGIYFINAPSVFETIYNLIRSFMNEKMRKRLKLLSKNNFHKVYSDIPKEVLPDHYDTNQGDFNVLRDEWKAKVESNREWYLEDNEYRSDEALRIGTPQTSSEIFGIEGTFRKLNID